MRAPTPAPAASAPTAAAAAVTIRDWEEGFVVLMTKGSYLGKLCVIIQKPDDVRHLFYLVDMQANF